MRSVNNKRFANLVDSLEPCIILERLESGAVALPKELEPRSDERAIRSILALIPTDGT